MRFLTNPGMASVRRHGKPVSRAAWRASGFRRNPKKPTARQLAARKKFAAMARARAKAARTRTRSRSASLSAGGTPMARRKRKAAVRRVSRRRRRAGAARRRSVARRTMHTNPRHRRRRSHRRTRRRSYRRNPSFTARGIVGELVQVGTGALGVVGGRAAYNYTMQNFGGRFISATDSTQVAAAKQAGIGALLAVGIKMLTKRGGPKMARFGDYAAVGALSAPLGNLLVNLLPASGLNNYLGDGVMAMPAFTVGGQRRLSSYAGGGMAAYAAPQMGAYSGESFPG